MIHKPIYLYVTPFFPSPKAWTGGFCLDAVRSIRADGRYEVVVMMAHDDKKLGGDEGDYEYDGFKVFKFQRKRICDNEYFETLMEPINSRLFLKKVKEALGGFDNIAVCHVHDFEHYIQYALALKRLSQKRRNNPLSTSTSFLHLKTLVHHHYAGYYRLNIGKLGVVPIWSDLLYLKTRHDFESVDAHVFISEHCKSKYGRRVDFDTGVDYGPLQNQLPWGKIYRSIKLPRGYVWYNGVDKKIFSHGERIEHGEFRIGCVANFNPCKRQIDLIRAMPHVCDMLSRVEGERCRKRIEVVFVGSGRTFEECKREAHEIESNFHPTTTTLHYNFLAEMPHDQLADFYRTLDLFVMPSVNEGFCCVNVEAQACGVPFMAVKGLPMEEVLSKAEHDKWLFKANEPEDLARHIVDYIKHPCEQKLTIDLDSDRLASRFLDWMEGK